jgi:phage terminase small subunit
MANALTKSEDEREDLSPEEEACLPRERVFIQSYLDTKNAAESARLAGAECLDAAGFARVGLRYLGRERVQKALAVVTLKRIKSLAPKAIRAYEETVDNALQPAVRLKAAMAILERISPTVTKTDVTITHQFDPIKTTLEFLAALKAQGWTREQLLAEFSPFELDHYEKLLALEDKSKITDVEFEEVPDPDADLLGE